MQKTEPIVRDLIPHAPHVSSDATEHPRRGPNFPGTEPLAWGLANAVPADAIAAWGARAIADKGDTMSIVWDRQGAVGNKADRRRLLFELNGLALKEAHEQYTEQRRRGRLQNSKAGRVTLVTGSHGFQLVADTHASYGYVYLAAWMTSRPKGGELVTYTMAVSHMIHGGPPEREG
jgi:hypothetical protein